MRKETAGNRQKLTLRMRHVLTEVVRSTFPLTELPDSFVAEHVWRDRKYVGESEGRVVAWRGFRANLKQIDFRYRGST